jgi:hypothetical protein
MPKIIKDDLWAEETIYWNKNKYYLRLLFTSEEIFFCCGASCQGMHFEFPTVDKKTSFCYRFKQLKEETYIPCSKCLKYNEKYILLAGL